MKLKQLPEDFQVEELANLQPEAQGPYAFYRLEKRGLGTPEALQAVCRRWKIQSRRISYGGLKDRHAQTAQYLTILHGPRQGMQQQNLTLRYLGQLAVPFSSEHIQGNRFQIVLRDLSEAKAAYCAQALDEVRHDGVANYFDDQRFGSVGPSGQFVARKLIDGDYEAALKLALVEPYEFDQPAQKREKRTILDHWGDGSAAKAELRGGDSRPVIAYLAERPGDFRGAFAQLSADLKSLYLAAYQSHLWNRMLARWIEQYFGPQQQVTIQLQLGAAPMPRRLDESQRETLQAQRMPLPSARLKLADDDPLKPLIDVVLQEEDLVLSQIKLKHFREPFFSKGDRAAFFIPENLTHRLEADDLHVGRQKLVLSFVLPRGCYATLLVKRIMAGPNPDKKSETRNPKS